MACVGLVHSYAVAPVAVAVAAPVLVAPLAVSACGGWLW